MPSLKAILEALIFASPEPVTARRMLAIVKNVPGVSEDPDSLTEQTIEEAVEELRADYGSRHCGIVLDRAAGGYRFYTHPEVAPWLRELRGEESFPKLSPAALETLALIAYAQPVSRSQIEAVRGVAVDSVLSGLLEKGLIQVVGRSPSLGKPLLYGTTTRFLEWFGLQRLEELPDRQELREVLLRILQEDAG
ncbi:SMC-Scp complex subunit ScpB [Candidatus Methylacidithermus pantelleriae]|uniref:Segregation and condensation protein B n=1 Tax=Candidatus Methylacidithermus pantelleriae TaxID=2744239 RepID=A0A8J2FN96_9BACT|nr:SMC-Scp complex subunit ScpB [Candidatus Methylacidithermus pantelleriae]CAF0689893.1 Segregation and condensation protein B [Candidatus Methylacidithermus pantelleriae]